jgi:hypothetical protein
VDAERVVCGRHVLEASAITRVRQGRATRAGKAERTSR